MTGFKDNLVSMSPDLMRIALKWTGNKNDAEDLVQEALLRAWEKQHFFKGGNQTAWVVTIMKRILIDIYRKNRNKFETEYKGDIPVDVPEIEVGVEIKEVNKALDVIGKKCKEILLLIAEEYKYKEISEHLEIPMGTVTNRLSRCRKKLHQKLYGPSKYNEI